MDNSSTISQFPLKLVFFFCKILFFSYYTTLETFMKLYFKISYLHFVHAQDLILVPKGSLESFASLSVQSLFSFTNKKIFRIKPNLSRNYIFQNFCCNLSFHGTTIFYFVSVRVDYRCSFDIAFSVSRSCFSRIISLSTIWVV